MSNFFRSCRDCKERTAGCHSTCEKYQREKEIADKQKAQIDQAKRADIEYTFFYRDQVNSKK